MCIVRTMIAARSESQSYTSTNQLGQCVPCHAMPYHAHMVASERGVRVLVSWDRQHDGGPRAWPGAVFLDVNGITRLQSRKWQAARPRGGQTQARKSRESWMTSAVQSLLQGQRHLDVGGQVPRQWMMTIRFGTWTATLSTLGGFGSPAITPVCSGHVCKLNHCFFYFAWYLS